MSILYTASATSVGGRDGGVRSSDGIQGGATNPEQLFAAGYAACFHSALKRIAADDKVGVRDSQVVVDVGIGPKGDGFGLEAEIKLSLRDVDRSVAESLVHRAHRLCPYSNATRNNIPVRFALIEAGDSVVAVS